MTELYKGSGGMSSDMQDIEDIESVLVAGVSDGSALEVDHSAVGEKKLKIRDSSNLLAKYINGFRFSQNHLRFALKASRLQRQYGQEALLGLFHRPKSSLKPRDNSEDGGEETTDEPTLVDQMVLLGFDCLQSTNEKFIPLAMRELLEVCSDGQTTMDWLQQELQLMSSKDPEKTRKTLGILSQPENLMGQHLIMRLYFGGWMSDPDGAAEFSFGNFQSVLNPRAFLTAGCGRVALNGFYHFAFCCLIMVALLEEHITEICWVIDLPLISCLVGQIAEEAHEFWRHPQYLKSFWNRIDACVICVLMVYFICMPIEVISRVALVVTELLLLIRLLGCLRNTDFMQAGLLIRITVAMVRQIFSFLLLYMFVVIVFATSFFFLFHRELEELEITLSMSSEERELRGGGGHSGQDHGGLHQAGLVFTNVASTALWLFSASLGDFHFEVFEGSKYEKAASGLLVAFLMLCAIILINFMIAILSDTYEKHMDMERLNYLMEVGADALQLPYHPSLKKPPWMPRPINLLNLFIQACQIVVVFCLESLGFAEMVAAVDLLFFRIQLFVFWFFGNVLVAMAMLFVHVLVVMPFCILAMMVTAPVSMGCFVANFFNGELPREWQRFRKSQPEEVGLWRTGKRFWRTLRSTQKFCFSGPFVGGIFVVVYWVFYGISEIPGSGGFFKLITGWEDMTLFLGTGRWPEHHYMWVHVWFDNFLVLMLLAIVWEIRWMFQKHKEAPTVKQGWDRIVNQARLIDVEFQRNAPRTSSGTAPITNFDSPARQSSSASGYRPLDMVEKQQVTNSNGKEGNAREMNASEDMTSASVAVVSQREPTSNVDFRDLNISEGEESRRSSNSNPYQSSRDNTGSSRERKGKRQFSLRKTTSSVTLEEQERLLPTRTGHYLVMNAAFFLEMLSSEEGVRPLILEALDLVYSSQEIKTYPVDPLGLYVSLADWYWLACSVLWCYRTGRTKFSFVPLEKHRPMNTDHRMHFVEHPIFGLYCSHMEEVGHGVFFEDYFWAVWDGSIHRRHIRIADLMQHLGRYARNVVASVEIDEVHELDHSHTQSGELPEGST